MTSSERRSGKAIASRLLIGFGLTMGLSLTAGRLQGISPTQVIVDEAALLPPPQQRPLSPAEQDGAGLRPNRKARRRTIALRR